MRTCKLNKRRYKRSRKTPKASPFIMGWLRRGMLVGQSIPRSPNVLADAATDKTGRQIVDKVSASVAQGDFLKDAKFDEHGFLQATQSRPKALGLDCGGSSGYAILYKGVWYHSTT